MTSGREPDSGITPPPTPAELQAILGQGSDLLIVLDAEAVCRWASPAGGRLLHIDASSLPGVPFRAFAHADDDASVSALLADAPAGPVPLRVHVSSAGHRWMSAVSVSRAADGGSSQGWVVALRDAQALVDRAAAVGDSRLEDELTGLPGRDMALAQLGWLLAATPRTGNETAVACCAIDDYDAMIETFAPADAAEVVRVVAGRIAHAGRRGDLAARMSAAQFLLILRGVHDLRGAIGVADKLRRTVESPIPLPSGDVLRTVSVGVTLVSRGEAVESVLARAEGALDWAREAGRNRVMSSPLI